MVDAVLAADPRLDVLVNNAGGGVPSEEAFGDPLDGGDEDRSAVFALNLDAAVRTTRAALPALVRTRGAVVNISSDSSCRPGSGPLPYSAAEAALNAFTRGLAERMAASGVRLNTVSFPGSAVGTAEPRPVVRSTEKVRVRCDGPGTGASFRPAPRRRHPARPRPGRRPGLRPRSARSG